MSYIVRLKTNIGTLKFTFNSENELANATIKELKIYIQKQIEIKSEDIIFHRESRSGLIEVTRDSKGHSNDDKTLTMMKVKSGDLLYLDCFLEKVSIFDTYVDPISKTTRTKEIVVVRPKMNNSINSNGIIGNTIDSRSLNSNSTVSTDKNNQSTTYYNNNSDSKQTNTPSSSKSLDNNSSHMNHLKELLVSGILTKEELQVQVQMMERYSNNINNNNKDSPTPEFARVKNNNNNNNRNVSSSSSSSSRSSSSKGSSLNSMIPSTTKITSSPTSSSKSDKTIPSVSNHHHYQQHSIHHSNLSFKDFIDSFHSSSLNEADKAALWKLYIESCDEADLCRALELSRVDEQQQKLEQQTWDTIHHHDVQAVKQISRKEYQQQQELNLAMNRSEIINHSQRESVNVYNISQALRNNSNQQQQQQQQRNGEIYTHHGTGAAAVVNTFSQDIENELFQRAIKRSLQSQQQHSSNNNNNSNNNNSHNNNHTNN